MNSHLRSGTKALNKALRIVLPSASKRFRRLNEELPKCFEALRYLMMRCCFPKSEAFKEALQSAPKCFEALPEDLTKRSQALRKRFEALPKALLKRFGFIQTCFNRQIMLPGRDLLNLPSILNAPHNKNTIVEIIID
jgi:hypothetical protein